MITFTIHYPQSDGARLVSIPDENCKGFAAQDARHLLTWLFQSADMELTIELAKRLGLNHDDFCQKMVEAMEELNVPRNHRNR